MGTAAAIFVALLGVLTVGPIPAPPAYADHNDMYLVCPSSITEGDSAFLEVRRPGYRMLLGAFLTIPFEADGEDFVPYNGTVFQNDPDSRALWVPVITKEDSLPEHDKFFAIGAWYGGVWHECLVTIVDDDTPQVTSVEITSIPVEGDTYRAGESIDITVTVDREVGVEDNPLLSLFLGEGEDSTWRGAEYHHGSGSRYLTFRYQVRTADRDTDGLSVSAAGVRDDGAPSSGFSGQIFAKGTDVPIDYTHPGVNSSADHKVDGRPYVQNIEVTSSPPGESDTYRANQIVELSMIFDTDVVVEGEVLAGLWVGYHGYPWSESIRRAQYLSGSGTDTLLFGYTVQQGDMDSEGIMIMGRSAEFGVRGDGTIKAKGTQVQWYEYYLGTNHLPDHKVDAVPPTIKSVTIESRPGNGQTYELGEFVEVAVTFSEKVTSSGALQLDLDMGGTPRQATLRSPTAQDRTFGEAIIFEYRVSEGDADTDGIGISANSLNLNSGAIRDEAGNAAGLSRSAVAADSHQKVDTSPEH